MSAVREAGSDRESFAKCCAEDLIARRDATFAKTLRSVAEDPAALKSLAPGCRAALLLMAAWDSQKR